MSVFKIKIIDQYWITKDPTDKTDDDWTISTTGLMLLKTINNDHEVDDTDPIIQHCGQIAMLGFPISIDCTVTHDDDKIIIHDVKKYPSTDEEKVIVRQMLQLIGRNT